MTFCCSALRNLTYLGHQAPITHTICRCCLPPQMSAFHCYLCPAPPSLAFIYLSERQCDRGDRRGDRTVTETDPPPAGSPLRRLQQPGLGQERRLGLPHGWQGLQCCSQTHRQALAWKRSSQDPTSAQRRRSCRRRPPACRGAGPRLFPSAARAFGATSKKP